jgi:asparagine synthase (glutamine-hydrolysing)
LYSIIKLKLLDSLIQELQNSIKDTILEKKIGVAFSGGVDSTLLAKLCKDLGYEITLLTIGFEGSHDISFSKKVNEIMKFPHKILEIDKTTFSETSLKIKDKIKTDNLSWNENCIAFYYVSKLANQNKIGTVATANGIDELFCGYNAYRDAIKEGEQKVQELMNSKLENEIKMMKAVNEVSSQFNVKILQPFLSEQFVSFAKKIPLHEKIKNSDDLQRKHIIRKIASEIGVPEISATKRKKALQYGSLIHKTLIKSR